MPAQVRARRSEQAVQHYGDERRRQQSRELKFAARDEHSTITSTSRVQRGDRSAVRIART